MRRAVTLFLFLFVFAISPAWAEGQKYTCPMHPHYIADEPGTCPICGMDLVPMEGGGDANAPLSPSRRRSSRISGCGAKKRKWRGLARTLEATVW